MNHSLRTCFAVIVCLVWIPSVTSTAQSAPTTDWRAHVHQELPLLGHRNWIAIVDSAYPLQTSAGIETIETNGDQLEVVRAVLDELAKAKHVRPVIFTDAELAALAESDATGVTSYREALRHFLGSMETQSLPHEQIIAKLDDTGKTFHVLVLKTNLTIPYTSVFLRLDCAYWSDEQEKRLRAKMAGR